MIHSLHIPSLIGSYRQPIEVEVFTYSSLAKSNLIFKQKSQFLNFTEQYVDRNSQRTKALFSFITFRKKRNGSFLFTPFCLTNKTNTRFMFPIFASLQASQIVLRSSTKNSVLVSYGRIPKNEAHRSCESQRYLSEASFRVKPPKTTERQTVAGAANTPTTNRARCLSFRKTRT